jgi:pyruvate/2-oxoglutarate dehydrogenase complex dihydrolipoamide acyltransferase (E2) component
MAIPIVMPQLGESVAEGTVLEWLKQEGDRVEKDEPILAISTEKVDAEIPAPASGVLTGIKVSAGQTAPVGATLATITERFASGTGIDLGCEPPVSVSASISIERRVPSTESKTEARKGRFYSPAVQALANELDLDLGEITGTGEGGRVTKKDVEAFARAQVQPVAEMPTRGGGEKGESTEEELIPLTHMRRSIAARMTQSLRDAPQVTSVVEADFTNIARFRDATKAAFRQSTGLSLTFLPFIVKATARVLPECPILNSRWTEEGIRVRKAVHLGIAVALPEGLAVPVLRSPGALSVSEIAKRIAAMVRRAQEGRLLPEELTGSTFTVNNFGADGNLIGTPILNPPEVGILGVGTIAKRAVVLSGPEGDSIGIRWRGYLCLSYDHRAVDGAMAGGFLKRVAAVLESFQAGQDAWADPVLERL